MVKLSVCTKAKACSNTLILFITSPLIPPRERPSRQRFEKETQIDKPAVDISAIEKDSPADILDKMQITEDDESSKRNHVLTTSAVSA